MRPRRQGEPPLGVAALRSGLAETGRDDEQRLDALRETVVEHRVDRFGGYGGDREVDLVGDVADGRVGADTPDGPVFGVDRIDRPGEPAAQHVHQHGVAHLAAVGGGTDDGDTAGTEDVAHAARLGGAFAGVADRDEGLGGVDRELEPDDSPFELRLTW